MMEAIVGKTVAAACLLSLTLSSFSSATEQSPKLEESHTGLELGWNWTVVGVVVVSVMVVVVVVYAAFSCTDCYNSEVSTDSHPASATAGAKWGGAGGYTSSAVSDVNTSVMGSGFAGEVIRPNDIANHPLPYALVPSQVPEAQGFRGYGPAETANAPSGGGGGTGGYQGGLAGYAASGGGGGQWESGGAPTQWGAGSNPSSGQAPFLPGAHVPLMSDQSQEPPPPYYSYR